MIVFSAIRFLIGGREGDRELYRLPFSLAWERETEVPIAREGRANRPRHLCHSVFLRPNLSFKQSICSKNRLIDSLLAYDPIIPYQSSFYHFTLLNDRFTRLHEQWSIIYQSTPNYAVYYIPLLRYFISILFSLWLIMTHNIVIQHRWAIREKTRSCSVAVSPTFWKLVAVA